MTRWLVLRLRAPLAAFGGEAIDARGVTRDFPSASALTGLFANALGWRRGDRDAHQRLQERLVFAARRDHEPSLGRLTDFQTVELAKSDRGWTTTGGPEGRDGGSDTYKSPHIRTRDYHADARLTVVVALRDPDEPPGLDDLAKALDRPARPLFIGRKPCLPTTRLFDDFLNAESAHQAIAAASADAAGEPLEEGGGLRALWPAEDDDSDAAAVREHDLTDERNWLSGLHGGARRVREGRVQPAGGAPSQGEQT